MALMERKLEELQERVDSQIDDIISRAAKGKFLRKIHKKFQKLLKMIHRNVKR